MRLLTTQHSGDRLTDLRCQNRDDDQRFGSLVGGGRHDRASTYGHASTGAGYLGDRSVDASQSAIGCGDITGDH
jgi:hypothetical protein